MEDEDDLFYEWFISISQELQKEHAIKDTELKEAISHIKELQDKGWKHRIYTNVDYDEIINCYAYLAVYAPCHAVIAREGIRWFYKEKMDLLNGIFERDILNIVCAGGGPGNDFLGFCYAIESLHIPFHTLKLTVIDLKGGWKKVMDRVMTEAQNGKGKIQSFLSSVQFSCNFVQADLTSDSVDALKQANLIIMTKVLSVVSDRQKDDMIKNIISSMTSGAVLMCIDVPLREVIACVRNEVSDVEVLMEPAPETKIFITSKSWPVMDTYYANGTSQYNICVLRKSIP